MTKTQIDRLGDTLRTEHPDESHLRQLDVYRRSFAGGYEHVVKSIRECLGLEPTGRPAKSTKSIIEKLQRESVRLSQMQDIAGCRVIVEEISEQGHAIEQLTGLFSSVTIVDRRRNPSHGYRAVHIIAKVSEKPIEIQVRTAVQHAWAELSEKLADVVDPEIKYGGGPDNFRALLLRASSLMERVETDQQRLIDALKEAPEEHLPERVITAVAAARKELRVQEEELRELLVEFTAAIREEESGAVSD